MWLRCQQAGQSWNFYTSVLLFLTIVAELLCLPNRFALWSNVKAIEFTWMASASVCCINVVQRMKERMLIYPGAHCSRHLCCCLSDNYISFVAVFRSSIVQLYHFFVKWRVLYLTLVKWYWEICHKMNGTRLANLKCFSMFFREWQWNFMALQVGVKQIRRGLLLSCNEPVSRLLYPTAIIILGASPDD